MHHRRAAWLFGMVVVLDLAFGILFGYADNVGIFNGLYFAVTTVTTVGYGDIVPHGWAAHLIAVAIMILFVPLWASIFSLVAAGFVADHVDSKHEQLKRHIDNNRHRD